MIFGMGTGRCGTWTLHRILQNQPDTVVTHEGFANPWEPDYCIFYEAILNMLVNYRAPIIGNIGWYWINYVGRILNSFDDPKCVCLKRPMDQVVTSFMNYLPGVNKWTDPLSVYWKPTVYSITPDRDQWPRYDAPRKRALERYWKDYYATAEFWQNRLPNNFLLIDMHEALNTEDGQHRMLSFLGYPEKDHMLFLNQKLNTPKDPKGRVEYVPAG